MPAPNPKRDAVLKYLKADFPHKMDFISYDGTIYSYKIVHAVVYSLRDNSPELLRILNYHMFTNLPRTRVAEEVGFDQSTVKRYLDKAADQIMQRLNHGDWPADDAFQIRSEATGEVYDSPFPVTYQKTW